MTKDEPNDYIFVLDFSHGKLAEGKPNDWMPDVDVSLNGGAAKVIDQRVMANPQTGGWRAFFRLLIPPDTKLLEMTCDLLDNKKQFSERWNYQWRR